VVLSLSQGIVPANWGCRRNSAPIMPVITTFFPVKKMREARRTWEPPMKGQITRPVRDLAKNFVHVRLNTRPFRELMTESFVTLTSTSLATFVVCMTR